MTDKVSPERLIGILGHWAAGKGPLHTQLASAIRRAIVDGALPSQCVLPSQRVMAQYLFVSRTTVLSAIEELKSQRLLASRQGSGTHVATDRANRDPQLPRWSVGSFRSGRLLGQMSGRGSDTCIDLSIGYPDQPYGVTRAMEGLAERDLAMTVGWDGFSYGGLAELREALAERLSADGIPTTSDQLLIATSAQQSLWMIAGVFASRGGVIFVEDPTCSASQDALLAREANLIGIPIDEDGISIEALERALSRARPSFVFTTPIFNNPTGRSLSPARAHQLLELCASRDLPVVEDLALMGLGFDETRRHRSLASYDSNVSIVSFGTMSKLFWRGLRVGWIRAGRSFIQRLIAVKSPADSSAASAMDQLVAARLLESYDDACTARANHLLPAAQMVMQAIGTFDPSWSCDPPQGGTSMWLRLPGADAMQFCQVALRHGVELWPGPIFSPSGGHRDRLRLSLGRSWEETQEGLRRLRTAWTAFGVNPSGEGFDAEASVIPLGARTSETLRGRRVVGHGATGVGRG